MDINNHCSLRLIYYLQLIPSGSLLGCIDQPQNSYRINSPDRKRTSNS